MEITIGIIVFCLIVFLIIFIKKNTNFSNRKSSSEIPVLHHNEEERNLHQINTPWYIKSYSLSNERFSRTENPLILSDNLKSHIENIVKLSPKAKELVKKEKGLIINFDLETLNKFKSGELKPMLKKGTKNQFRALAIDQKNVIRKHGWIEVKEVKKVNPAQLANLAYGALSIVTAQEYLDRIDKQLTKIDQKMNSMLLTLHYDKVGKFQGNIKYLKSILPDIRDNITSSKVSLYITKIEDITLQCYQDIESVLNEFPHILNKIESIQERKLLGGLDKIIDEINDLSNTFEQKLNVGFGNIEVLSICLKLKAEFDSNSQVSIMRLEDIEKTYNDLDKYHKQFINIITNKKLGLNAKLWTSNAINKRKENIEKQLQYHNKNIKDIFKGTRSQIDQIKYNEKQILNSPIDLHVEYDDDDNLKAVYHLKS